MHSYCTLFNSGYLARGLTMYESLRKINAPFHLYIFAFDDECYEFLHRQNYPYITVISLAEFEDEDLLRIKPTRSAVEYFWTCTPSTILFCISKFNLPDCTYIDADMIFYSDPAVLLDEIGNNSVLISEHRYTKLYDQSEKSGIYCVQFMCFKNTEEGMTVLRWWRNACLEWCYSYYENGKFGDQKYLDNWPAMFKGVHVLQHEGGGIAPWNMQQYQFIQESNNHWVINKKTKLKSPLIFFHFHGVIFYNDKKVVFCPQIYELSQEVKSIYYIPYVRSLKILSQSLPGINFNPNGTKGKAPTSFTLILKYYKNFLQYLPNDLSALFRLKNFNFKKHLHLFKL